MRAPPNRSARRLQAGAALLTIAVILCACANTTAPVAATIAPPGAASMPEEAAAGGPFRHQPTGMGFPDRVAGFSRVRAAHLDADGSDAAVAYDLVSAGGAEVAATVWLHRRETLMTVGQSAEAVSGVRAAACAALLDRQEAAMLRDHIGATPPSRRPFSLPKGGRRREGTQVTSTYSARFAGRTQAIRTELDLFCDVEFAAAGAWTLEFRFSAPARDDPGPRIAAFMGALDWGPPG